jgi:putative transposase
MSAVGSCADNAAAASFFGVLKREREPPTVSDQGETRADVFDYIERWHNPRHRRRLAGQQQEAKLLTHVSVETGWNPPVLFQNLTKTHQACSLILFK